MASLKRLHHWPSFLWGAGIMTFVFGAAHGDAHWLIVGIMVYALGHVTLRWQPHY